MALDSADKVWKIDETAALIALYESERFLYDPKEKNYHNSQKRIEGYERIRQVMLRIRPECTLSEIKSRIKYIRSQYASELLRKTLSIESGLCNENTYKPALWCFGLLLFLDDFLSTKKCLAKIVSSEEEDSSESDLKEASLCSSSVSKRKSTKVNKENSEPDKKEVSLCLTSSASKRKSTKVNEEVSEPGAKEASLCSSFLSKRKSTKVNEEVSEPSTKEASSCSTSSTPKRKSTNVNEEVSEPGTKEASSCSTCSTPKRKSTKVNGVNHCCDVERNGDLEVIERNKFKKKKEDCSSSSGSIIDTSEKLSAENNCDREDIFGQYVASEMRTLKNNSLLYLQTKQSILEILGSKGDFH